MAYALVITASKINEKQEKCMYSCIQTLTEWFKKFFPAQIGVEFLKTDCSILLYIITMPSPKEYFLKNKQGRKQTLKKWLQVIKKNEISKYLLEKSLEEYLDGGWCIDEGPYLIESIKRNAHIIFKMEPLRNLKTHNLSITISGADRKWMTCEIKEVLERFKQINTIKEETSLDDFWDDFISETGVPVRRTDDVSVLSRSDIWLSYNGNSDKFPFSGVHVNLAKKSIYYTDAGKQYQLGYVFSQKMIRKLGLNVIRRYNHDLLACFLLYVLVHDNEYLLVTAEEILGIKFIIVTSRSKFLTIQKG